MIEFEKKFEAPALARGLGLLKIMMSEEEFSLDKLAELTETPKSSLLRLLDTLQMLDYVSKDEFTKMYSSTKVIVNKENYTTGDIGKNLPNIMESICFKLSRSVEWYISTEAGMTLVDRVVPEDMEVQIRAKIGFIRRWGTELEAVSAIAYAFDKTDNNYLDNLYKVDEKGIKTKLSSNEILKHLENAKSNKYVYDKHYNSNGIRRAAIPILNKGELVGILAIAEHKTFHHHINGKNLITTLNNEASRLLTARQ